MTRPSSSRAASSASPRLIILARAGRQLAAAARRAGFLPLVADAFGDIDTRALAAHWLGVEVDAAWSLDAGALLDALGRLQDMAPKAPVVWASGFEDRAGLLARLATRCELLGTAPAAVAAFARPAELAAQLHRLGIPTPAIHLGDAPPAGHWLRKQAGAAGGAHVQDMWGAGREGGDSDEREVGDTHRMGKESGDTHQIEDTHDLNGDTHYFQAWVAGRSLSITAVVASDVVAVLGCAEHLFWPDAQHPYRYGGAVARPHVPQAVLTALTRTLQALATHCGLRGLCGIDFVLEPDGSWQLIEINPRPTATFDLLAHPGDALRAHLAACRGRRLPRIRRHKQVHAHAVYYAPSAFALVKSLDWPAWISDRPPVGSRFEPGVPVCTVRAAGGDADAARLHLHRRLHQLREALGLEDRSLPTPRHTLRAQGARP